MFEGDPLMFCGCLSALGGPIMYVRPNVGYTHMTKVILSPGRLSRLSDLIDGRAQNPESLISLGECRMVEGEVDGSAVGDAEV